ncbi:MAG TPA: hypothetical protein VIE89_02920 [Candidatus Binatia bacterium]
MAHPFGNPSFSSNAYSGAAGYERSLGRSRVFLVAIHGGLFTPPTHERDHMERMRVVVLPPSQASEFESSDLLPGVFRRALPPMPPALPMARQEQPRPVRGEILRDQAGRMYEKIGDQIRPLNKLVTDSGGQVLELVPTSRALTETYAPVETDAPPIDAQKTQRAKSPEDGRQRKPSGAFNQAGAAVAIPKPAPYRKLFPDPGQWRVIRLGEFKAMLAPQLVDPERVRDTHRLACYLQVYEVTTAQRLESLAAAVLGDVTGVNQLQLITGDLIHQLGLASLLRNRPRVPGNFPREAGLLLPGERLFRLQLAQDPTADNPVSAARQPATNVPPQVSSSGLDEQFRPSVPGRGPKTAVPERYLKPWEFKSTRDEALYDINVTATFASWISSLSTRLKGWIKNRGELKKWQVLLSGKSLEEQLWAVRPPQGGVSHPAIRDWARKTLDSAGYDSRVMLLEWEIFWRRKGQ